MKDNKEFINGIYTKYNEYIKSKEKKKYGKIQKYMPLIGIVAMVTIILAIGITYKKRYAKNNTNETEISKNEEIEEINLAKVGTFENFYNLIKENNITNDGLNQEEQKSEETETLKDTDQTISNYSTTNTQVENVDEGDIVKTDGNYIYYIANNKIVIIDTKENTKKSEILYTDKNPREIYVNKNKLIVITSSNEIKTETKSIYETADVSYVDGIKIKTTAIIYNILDKENPQEERKVEMEGTYISSRMIEDNIYMVTNKYISNAINMVKNYSIEELNEQDYKPTYMDTAVSNEVKYIEFDKIRYFDDKQINNYLLLCGFNINKTEEVDIKAFLGAGQIVYASQKNMYVAKVKTIYDINTYSNLGEKTQILKFELSNGKIKYKAENTIEGKILNQFSIDEDQNENLRIAVTQEKSNINNNLNLATSTTSEQIDNRLYILDNKLNQIGSIEGLANGENIYAVRYVKDKAYVVTYKIVDPLFVIDISDPKNPKKVGELKIPGYSTYLHPYDDTHIIGLGYDTNSNGSRNTNNGLKISMFDVSDINNPKEIFNQKIGNNTTYSEATYNHKAILYLKDKNIMAFSIQKYQNRQNISEALIYGIDIEKGFVLKGKYSENTTNNYRKSIKRIVYSNNMYYVLSEETIAVLDDQNYKTIQKIDIE